MLDVSHDGVDPHVRTSSSFPLTPSPCSAAGAEGGSLSPEELAEVFSEYDVRRLESYAGLARGAPPLPLPPY